MDPGDTGIGSNTGPTGETDPTGETNTCAATCATTLTNAEATCIDGACVTFCSSTFRSCDGDTSNGCETDTNTSFDHCGFCDKSCDVANAAATCTDSVCTIDSCDHGWADCNVYGDDGCETNTASDTSMCGTCGIVCEATNAIVDCALSSCTITSCAPGYDDCDLTYDNGCEHPVTDDTGNCGACNHACPAPSGAVALCEEGTCGMRCQDGFGDCDADESNGCEVELGNTAAHCGACNYECPLAPTGGTVACQIGQCVFDCAADRGNCDADWANGCEANLTNDEQNCGGCSNDCHALARPPNSVGYLTCSSSQCQLSCPFLTKNCDGNETNGCETPADFAHCDGCNACDPGEVCALSFLGTHRLCATQCSFPSEGLCGPTGQQTCVKLSLDPHNCGSCGNECFDGERCVSGACTCPAPMINCVGRCVDPNDDSNNCGGCGTVCTGGSECDDGTCECPGVFDTYCPLSPNQCPDLGTDADNCSVCGNQCPEGGTGMNSGIATCRYGACRLTCKEGYVDTNDDPADGCECHERGEDIPDLDMIDADCDGIDGAADAIGVIYVATNGDDAEYGLVKTQPVRTIQRAFDVQRQISTVPMRILVADGDYHFDETAHIRAAAHCDNPQQWPRSRTNGIYGGYSAANNWTRNVPGSTHLIADTNVAISIESNCGDYTFQNLTIESRGGATGDSIVVHADGSRQSKVIFENVTLIAADGAPGVTGSGRLREPSRALLTDGPAWQAATYEGVGNFGGADRQPAPAGPWATPGKPGVSRGTIGLCAPEETTFASLFFTANGGTPPSGITQKRPM